MPDPLLSAFPPPLLRRVLCGGDGLPPAWGPLQPIGRECLDTWHPLVRLAYEDTGRDLTPLQCPQSWRLPLDHWRPRLATVAVWLLTGDVLHASVDRYDPDWIVLSAWRGGYAAPEVWYWRADGTPGSAAIRLPMLAEHLRDHDPAVALLLALHDAPEVRARLNGGARDHL